ncbi:MAG TPA: peptidyl-prolyl cis-trans isomerase, partial [Candidatus Omnitrophota bacterium]|nr:peptidyl-prolyl cis-trans isomerase [Candidatus Omnitrophota bacterium]
LEATRNQAIIQFGDKFSAMQPQLDLESQAIERLLLLKEAKKRKLNAADQEVIELIESYPFFKNSKNQFDKRIYSQMLQYVFHTQPRIFEEESRQNLMLAKLYKEVTKGVSLTEEEIKEEYRKSNEELSIDYLAGIPSDFLKDINTGEEELKEYFSKNSYLFKQPITFNLEYAVLENEESLKKIALRLKKKENFTKVAKAFKLEAKETGEFPQTGPIPGIGWSLDILSLLSKAKPGEVLPAIKTDKNLYLLRLKERKDPYIPDLEKIKDKVKKAFLEEKTKKIAKEKTEQAFKKLKEEYLVNPKAIDFKKWADEFGLKADSTGSFKYGSYIEGLGSSDNFWIKAIGLKDGEFSQVLDEPSGFYIIKLKSKTAMDEKKFLEEKQGFSQKLLLEKQQDYFLGFVEGLKKKAGIF